VSSECAESHCQESVEGREGEKNSKHRGISARLSRGCKPG
jgi:hypothetical protein